MTTQWSSLQASTVIFYIITSLHPFFPIAELCHPVTITQSQSYDHYTIITTYRHIWIHLGSHKNTFPSAYRPPHSVSAAAAAHCGTNRDHRTMSSVSTTQRAAGAEPLCWELFSAQLRQTKPSSTHLSTEVPGAGWGRLGEIPRGAVAR